MRTIQFVRINSHFEPFITTDKIEKIDKQVVHINEKNELCEADSEKLYAEIRLTSYKDGDDNLYYSFGLLTKDPIHRPGHGGEWSSNSLAINNFFQKDLRECAVRTEKDQVWCAMAIARNDIDLPDNLEWRWDGLFQSIMPKHGILLPKGTDYYHSTKLDEQGNIIYPVKKEEISSYS